MSNFKRTTVTSALPYANGPVHIGHLAGVYVPADIYVRYLRLKGEEVLFIGGSDEHGVPITIKAKKEGVTPQDIVDRYHGIIKNHSKILVFRSIFIRAPLPKHIKNWLLKFLRPSKEKVVLLKKQTNSITTKRLNNSLPTAISPVNVRTVVMKMRMATNVNRAELP